MRRVLRVEYDITGLSEVQIADLTLDALALADAKPERSVLYRGGERGALECGTQVTKGTIKTPQRRTRNAFLSK